MKKTKIICTIGPASDSKDTLTKLIDAGLNAARLNFSHGNHLEHSETIKKIREAARESSKKIAIILDTKGAKVRTGKLKGGQGVALKNGQDFTLIADNNVIGNSKEVGVSYAALGEKLEVGDTVFVDNGLISLVVKGIEGNKINCIVTNSGELGENKGINLPGIHVDLPSVSQADIEDLKFGCDYEVDYIAASFMRNASDVEAVRKVLCENGGEDILIISKIETQEGLDNFDEILSVSDGIMVARGDLGIEIPVQEVPFAQKDIIKKCNESGKIVITATQMLESMVKHPRPTRAEAGDVANAILDGTDVVMLSGETAKGIYPVEATETMTKIAEKTDDLMPVKIMDYEGDAAITEAVARGTVKTSEILNARLIAVSTETGRAARAVRKYFPSAQVLAITNNDRTSRQLALVKGVYTAVEKGEYTIEEFYKRAEDIGKELGFVDPGDIMTISCGEKIFQPGTTNSFKVVEVL